MSRPAKNEMAAHELGMRLTELRDKATDPASAKDAELWIYARFDTKISDESIRRAHNAQVDPTACDVTLLIALAAFYRVEPEALGRFAADRIAKTMRMASTVPTLGPDTPPEQAERKSGWTPVLVEDFPPVALRAVS